MIKNKIAKNENQKKKKPEYTYTLHEDLQFVRSIFDGDDVFFFVGHSDLVTKPDDQKSRSKTFESVFQKTFESILTQVIRFLFVCCDSVQTVFGFFFFFGVNHHQFGFFLLIHPKCEI